MSADELPPRPRLAAHVLARRHVIDGEEHVILHDQQREDVLRVGRREWALLEAADGTRDLEGIVVAARREGAHARVDAVRELLATLAALGMLEAGEAAAPRATIEDAPPRPAATATPPKPLVPLPGEGMRCSGAGTCCHLYGTVMLFPHEARRVQTLLPEWRVGTVAPARWFTPVRGSEPGPVLAAIANDGACGFLQPDGLCAVHRVGGATAKPGGCQSFPRIFVDDGLAVHVSAKPECPCMLDPRGGEPEPLVDPAWIDGDALPSTIAVRRLPESITLAPGCEVSLAEARAWISVVAARAVPLDPAATLWALADRVARGRLPPALELDEAWSAGPPEVTAVQPWLDALHRHAAARAREHSTWRSERDLVRRLSTALATLTLLLRDGEALAEALVVTPEHPDQEARYWHMGVHGYRWIGRSGLVVRLRDEALRMWLGRSLSAVLGERDDDPHMRAPLALVEALLRAHGIGRYVDDLAQNV